MLRLFQEPQDNGGTIDDIRNYLAGQVVGITRDDALLDEVLKCVFCRMELERCDTPLPSRPNSTPDLAATLYSQMFADIQRRFPDLFEGSAGILLEPHQVHYIDCQLSMLNLSDSSRDVLGDIYQAFIGTAHRGQEGQFFTPRNAVQALVRMTDPNPDDIIIDPACGAGGFLLEAAYAVARHGCAPERIYGIDKDNYLARLARLRLAIQLRQLFEVRCADSLAWRGNGFEDSAASTLAGKFTLVLTNPPFGSKIVAVSQDSRKDFKLARKWAFSKQARRYHETREFLANPAPQVLFIERCLSLLAPNGRMGIVVPESVLSNAKYRHVVQYILDNSSPLAIIGMPESLFKTSGKGGTHTKVCLMVLDKAKLPETHRVFMAEAKWCGHDSRGKPIEKDDLPRIVSKYLSYISGDTLDPDYTGFVVPIREISNNILVPRFYNPEPRRKLHALSTTHDLYAIGDLVSSGHLSIASGDELGKLSYGTGDIPFVRTSDISNWEIKVDPKHGVSEELYQQYARKQDVREGDILMVRDGTYLIGTCAMVTQYDVRMVYQSHLYKIRIHPGAPLDNYLLLAALSSSPVVAQIRSLSFTMDIIDTLGDRIHDVILPMPKDPVKKKQISDMVRSVVQDRIEARELARRARMDIVDTTS